jgi:hypothetical protein
MWTKYGCFSGDYRFNIQNQDKRNIYYYSIAINHLFERFEKFSNNFVFCSMTHTRIQEEIFDKKPEKIDIPALPHPEKQD